jgi:hypothetical protein
VGFSIDDAVRRWPWLYHNTDVRNLPAIESTRRFRSAMDVLDAAGPDWVRRYGRTRRRSLVGVPTSAGIVWLKDQSPLATGAVLLEPGTVMEDVVAMINERVFFWPGTDDGPIEPGRGHAAVYGAEVTLRFRFLDVLEANPASLVTFSRVNSGAARTHGGRKQPRGTRTFTSAAAAAFGVSEIKEVTFVGAMVLPKLGECAGSPSGPWRQLWSDPSTAVP